MSFETKLIRFLGFWHPLQMKGDAGETSYTSLLHATVINRSAEEITRLTLWAARVPWLRVGTKFLDMRPLTYEDHRLAVGISQSYKNIAPHSEQTRPLSYFLEDEPFHYWYLPYKAEGALASGEAFQIETYKQALDNILEILHDRQIPEHAPSFLTVPSLKSPHLFNVCPP